MEKYIKLANTKRQGRKKKKSQDTKAKNLLQGQIMVSVKPWLLPKRVVSVKEITVAIASCCMHSYNVSVRVPTYISCVPVQFLLLFRFAYWATLYFDSSV